MGIGMIDSTDGFTIDHGSQLLVARESDAYSPPWWLRSGHLQTILAGSISRFAPQVEYRRERWITPDEDFIDLDWVKSTAAPAEGDIYVAFHGLQSNSRAPYLRSLMSAVAERGQRGVVVHFRGCSGVPNRRPRAYHSADSDEVDWILRRLRTENPDARIFAVGYSLGGAALLKWLGEPHRQSAHLITKAVAVSAPVDLREAAQAVSCGFARIYSWAFIRKLKPIVLALLERFPELERKLDRSRIQQMRTLLEFDELVTAPLHGFKSAREYHDKGSAKHGLPNVRVPTLLIVAKDDPIVLNASIEDLRRSDAVRLERPRFGGHAAFLRKSDRGWSSWIPDRALRFFSDAREVQLAPSPPGDADGFGLRGWSSTIGGALLEFGMLLFLRRARWHRWLGARLQRRARVWRAGKVTIVTGAHHVREVLARDDDFLLGPINQHQVLVGDFLLSLDPGPQYQTEKMLVRRAFPSKRVPRMERMTERLARFAARRLTHDDKLDVVHFAELVTVAIAKSFWGLDFEGARSKVLDSSAGAETMRYWLRYLGAAIAAPGDRNTGTMQIARACRDEFVCFVQNACQSPRLKGVLRCLVCVAPEPSFAWRNVAGIVVTASVVVTKAFVNALTEILSREQVRLDAIDAAKRGDRARLAAIVVEALRFNPVFPFLARYVPRDTVIKLDDETHLDIPAGSTLVLSALTAMFDPLSLQDPESFQAGRELQLNPRWADASGKYGCPYAKEQRSYLHFSGGTHWCPADQLAIAEVTAMMMVVLARAPRQHGRIRYDGIAADKLEVRFGA